MVHFIWAGWTGFDSSDGRNEIKNLFKMEMKKQGIKQSMITFLFRWRQHCVTNEKNKEIYKQGGKVIGREYVKKSIGDDLEDFLESIKNKKVQKEVTGPDGYGVETFHLAMLTPNEKRKLEIEDQQYKRTFYRGWGDNPDVPKFEMDKSESTSKYALSICERNTFIISSEAQEYE